MKDNQVIQTFNINSDVNEIYNPKSLICAKDFIATHACDSKDCQFQAFVCQNKLCSCKIQHEDCQLVQVQQIFNNLNKKYVHSSSLKSLKQYIQKHFQIIIDQLSVDRDHILNFIQNNQKLIGLNQKQQLLLNRIENQKTKQITRNQIWEIHLNIGTKSDIQKQIQNFNKSSEKISCKFFQQRQNLFNKIKQTLLNKIIKPFKNQNRLSQMLNNSKIITSTQINQIQTLNTFFQNKKINKVTLLYRASQNNLQILKFYHKCDKIDNTLLLVQTQSKQILVDLLQFLGKSLAAVLKMMIQEKLSYFHQLIKTSLFMINLSLLYIISQQFTWSLFDFYLLKYIYSKKLIYIRKNQQLFNLIQILLF